MKYPNWSKAENEKWERVFERVFEGFVRDILTGLSVKQLYNKGYGLYHLDDGGIQCLFEVRDLIKEEGLEFDVTVQGNQLKITMKWEGMNDE